MTLTPRRDRVRDFLFLVLAVLCLIAALMLPSQAQDFNHVKKNGTEVITPNFPIDGAAISNPNISELLGIGGPFVVGSSKYPDLQSCFAAIPTSGGTCIVPPLLPPMLPVVLSSNLTCPFDYTGILFTGPQPVTAGSNQFIVPAGRRGCFIRSWGPFGSFVGVANTGVEWNYTGNAAAFSVGGSGTDTNGFDIEDIGIFLNNAGSSAVGINVIRSPSCKIKDVRIIGPGGVVSQKGIVLDGTGNYTGCIVEEPLITGELTGIQLTGSGVNAGNANKIIGGQIGSPASGGSTGIDFQASSGGNFVWGTDVENHAVGYNFGGSAQGNFVVARSEANISGATLGASTNTNHVELLNTTDTISDSGTNNTTCTNGICQLVQKRLRLSGSTPSCSVTGAGTGASCAITTGSTDSGGVLSVTTGTTPGSSGTITLTYSSAYGSNGTSCNFNLANNSSSWNARATVIGGFGNTTSAAAAWDNNAVTLTASQASAYAFTYTCTNRG